jgi:hypothetical protein
MDLKCETKYTANSKVCYTISWKEGHSERAPEYATFILVNLLRTNVNSVQINFINTYIKLQLYIISVR